MKVGIVGFGFVGKALFNSMKSSVNTIRIDPVLNTTIKDLVEFKPEIVFITVPTPMLDTGKQDISILEECIGGVIETKALIVIKSTVLPNHLESLKKRKINFIYNPEFLREKYAYEDFINSKLIILGGEEECAKKVSDFYKTHTKCIEKNHIFTDEITASFVKYSINTFLSNKVIFFNQLKNIFDKSTSTDSWENFINILSIDKRIGSSHMDVPGNDGRLGYGGACFPKDTKAFLDYSKYLAEDFSLLSESININNNLRSLYNEPTKREFEQNISFDENED